MTVIGTAVTHTQYDVNKIAKLPGSDHSTYGVQVGFDLPQYADDDASSSCGDWRIGRLGPLLGRHLVFAVGDEEKAPKSIARFRDETVCSLTVMDRCRAEVPFLALWTARSPAPSRPARPRCAA